MRHAQHLCLIDVEWEKSAFRQRMGFFIRSLTSILRWKLFVESRFFLLNIESSFLWKVSKYLTYLSYRAKRRFDRKKIILDRASLLKKLRDHFFVRVLRQESVQFCEDEVEFESQLSQSVQALFIQDLDSWFCLFRIFSWSYDNHVRKVSSWKHSKLTIFAIHRSLFVLVDIKSAKIAIENWNYVILLISIKKHSEEDDICEISTIEKKKTAHHFHARLQSFSVLEKCE